MKLYWLDLETTGLDPSKCDILEVAILEAPFDKPFDATVLYQGCIRTSRTDAELDPFILDMHTKNGLLADCRGENGWQGDLDAVEADLLALIPALPKEDLGILAGSSIHFDHAFIRQHMPLLAKRLSHRHYDVSSIALFCRSLGMPHLKRDPGHRAMADVLDSIEYAKQCLSWLQDAVLASCPRPSEDNDLRVRAYRAEAHARKLSAENLQLIARLAT